MDALPHNDLVSPGIGHNQPPAGASALARERAEKLVKSADVWAGVKQITSAEQADLAKDALDQLRDEWNRIDDERKTEKKPHDEAALAVQRRYKPILAMIEACTEVIVPLRRDWLRREDERLAQERRDAAERAAAAQREAEAAACKAEQATEAPVSAKVAAEQAAKRVREAQEAVAAIPDRARVSGSYGRPARSLRTVWSGTVVDVLKAARYYRDKPELIEVLTRLVCADARAGVRAVPGCEITSRKE